VIRTLILRILSRLSRWLHPPLTLEIAPTAKVIQGAGVRLKGTIRVGENAVLIIGEQVQFSGDLNIGEGCKVTIGDRCEFSNISITLLDKSEWVMGADCICDAPAAFPNKIWLENGRLEMNDHVRIQAEILVRFGGVLRMGTWSSINYLSEIRCEEQITIGEYCLFSYEVCIYDTNTHSVNWQERRERIPLRGAEIKRPGTKPVWIGDDVWIGKGASILKGATIGSKSIIGMRTSVPAGVYPEGSRIVSPKPILLNNPN